MDRLRVLQRVHGVANARASRRICIEGQTDIVNQLLMGGGKTDIRDDGRLVRRFDESCALAEVKE
jgi:hypothetical protein